MAAPIDILHLFPELTAIGQKDLQVYCDEWMRRPIGRKYGIAQLDVDARLMIDVGIDSAFAGFVDERVFIPFDELLGYIVDRHFSDADERRRLHANIRESRQRWSTLNRDDAVLVGKVGALYIMCKGCRAMLETAHRGIEGQVVNCPLCELTCPACGHSDVYAGSDLQLKMDGA